MSLSSILIVEDEAIVAADLAGKLQQLGYSVAGSVASGEEAIEFARRQRPALVLMDIRLTGVVDGITAADTIRREWGLPVVFLTAHSDAATLDRAKLSEPFGYIIKPFEERELRSTIEIVLYKHQVQEERLRVAQRLEEAARLESLVGLTGGIAHSFNNLLTIILGHASLAQRDLAPASPLVATFERIKEAALRAADLSQRMLAYSGQGCCLSGSVDLGRLVGDARALLKHSIGRSVAIEVHLAQELPPIQGDAVKLREVIRNLVINASEAIGDKPGRIRLTTGWLRADRKHLDSLTVSVNLPEGDYVFAEVADNGCGISPESFKRIFDPFFTTKFVGRGLGLALVQGIVLVHHGGLRVISEPGQGTAITVFLPVASGQAGAATVAPRQAEPVAEQGFCEKGR